METSSAGAFIDSMKKATVESNMVAIKEHYAQILLNFDVFAGKSKQELLNVQLDRIRQMVVNSENADYSLICTINIRFGVVLETIIRDLKSCDEASAKRIAIHYLNIAKLVEHDKQLSDMAIKSAAIFQPRTSLNDAGFSGVSA